MSSVPSVDYKASDIKKIEQKIAIALIVTAVLIVVCITLGAKALKCHFKIQERWEVVHTNRAFEISNSINYQTISTLTHQGWGLFAGVIVTAVLASCTLGYAVHQAIERAKAKTFVDITKNCTCRLATEL